MEARLDRHHVGEEPQKDRQGKFLGQMEKQLRGQKGPGRADRYKWMYMRDLEKGALYMDNWGYFTLLPYLYLVILPILCKLVPIFFAG